MRSKKFQKILNDIEKLPYHKKMKLKLKVQFLTYKLIFIQRFKKIFKTFKYF